MRNENYPMEHLNKRGLIPKTETGSVTETLSSCLLQVARKKIMLLLKSINLLILTNQRTACVIRFWLFHHCGYTILISVLTSATYIYILYYFQVSFGDMIACDNENVSPYYSTSLLLRLYW